MIVFNNVIKKVNPTIYSIFDSDFRCLNPGKYALHIERWLDYFHHNNLHIIDGDQLKSNPVDVLDQFQKFLKITPPFDYSSHIRCP